MSRKLAVRQKNKLKNSSQQHQIILLTAMDERMVIQRTIAAVVSAAPVFEWNRNAPERRSGPFKTTRLMVKVDSQENH